MAGPVEILIVVLAFGLVGIYLAFARMLIRQSEKASAKPLSEIKTPAPPRATSSPPNQKRPAHSRPIPARAG
jgi:hypothetical protein